MGIAVLLALTGASVSILNDKAMIPGTGIAVKTIGLSLLGLLFVLAVILHFKRKKATS
jgi:LPXTG-motif cell wall-anchored protein